MKEKIDERTIEEIKLSLSSKIQELINKEIGLNIDYSLLFVIGKIDYKEGIVKVNSGKMESTNWLSSSGLIRSFSEHLSFRLQEFNSKVLSNPNPTKKTIEETEDYDETEDPAAIKIEELNRLNIQ